MYGPTVQGPRDNGEPAGVPESSRPGVRIPLAASRAPGGDLDECDRPDPAKGAVARVNNERERTRAARCRDCHREIMIEILRLGHRPERDKRITTHVCLVARAFGADSVVISTPDAGIERNLNSVTKRFGGDFKVRTGVDWRRHLREFKGTKVHLTMYGEKLEDAVPKIPLDKPILVIVGASKVPKQVYSMADINVSVGNQPHSEVAALALLLDRLHGGKQLQLDFKGPVWILPCSRGKSVIDKRTKDERARDSKEEE